MQDKVLAAFNLVGGTALSLKLGHRKSIDIDLFTDKDFDPHQIARHLLQMYKAENIRILKNGVFSFINKVKVDVLAHQYPLINKVESIDGIRMLSLEDIGAMKLNAILNNGTRIKDFVDLHRLLEHLPLQKMTKAFEQKYPNVNRQMAHTALLYHHDINRKDKIDYIGPDIPWDKIAERLKEAVINNHTIFREENIRTQQQQKLKAQQKPSQRTKQSKGPKL
jgi:hypothetical protein